MFIYPELKRLRSDADIPIVIDMIEAAKVDQMCCVQSFSVGKLAVVRGLNKNVEVGALGSSTNISFLTGLIDTLAGLGKGVMLWDSTATLAVPQMVEYAFSKGVDWGVYVIDQNRYLAPIRKMGISRIMSNVSLKVEK